MTAHHVEAPNYLEHAFVSPAHPLTFLGLVVLAVNVPVAWNALTGILCVTAAVLADAMLLLMLSGIPGYRRLVDADLAEEVRRAAMGRRAELLEQMADGHRHELLELESLVDVIRSARVARGVPVEGVAEACGDLLTAFVRLAIQHRRGVTCLGSFDRAKLDQDAAALEKARSGCDGQVRAVVEHRLALIRERSELWDTGCARLRAIEEQLAIVAERIRLAHEDALAPPAPDPLRARIAEPAEAVLDEQELEDVRVEEEVDARMLALGRPPR